MQKNKKGVKIVEGEMEGQKLEERSFCCFGQYCSTLMSMGSTETEIGRVGGEMRGSPGRRIHNPASTQTFSIY